MAEIDKSLPNTLENLSNEQEIEQVIQETEILPSGETEILENEDGSVEINFDPSTQVNTVTDHNANLADFVEEDILNRLGSELYQNYQEYKTSRKDWERTYREGLDLLGFKYDNRTEPFQGASGATHPVLAEAVTQFQSLAYK